MPDKSYLDWPFFDNQHRALAESVEVWAATHIDQIIKAGNGLDDICIHLVRALGDSGICRHAVAESDGPLDVRSLCVIRETLAQFSGLADFAFAMQGLGSGAISLFGTETQKNSFCPVPRVDWPCQRLPCLNLKPVPMSHQLGPLHGQMVPIT